MAYSEWIEVASDSGNIERTRRDDVTGITEIQFRPRKKGEPSPHYRSNKPLSEREWTDFTATAADKGNSTGSHFHNHLRGTKDFKKL